ncbi:transporter, SSS family [Actinokineospora alba]|uniref:Transporter, SSS family n=1 Tax=Actinokineospora alba TaxID=504798 RepID=A0A1H0I3R3_9PSEU|nr:sodium:solute symporter [Actinokineospora alba]TDP64618.1 SSS family transporter [Actinokineospora alba]SDI85833.1 transporter, SSS family [Actinokineospora alba]SDO26056.1 transporter, SSS family [Actinokineospora alba]
MRALDLAIIVVFLVGMPLLGIWIAGRQRSGSDYFVGEGKISWWVACLSVVSAETSTLTVLSVPTVAYLGAFTYLQLAIGYVIGRIVVSFVLLPRYVAGNMTTAYNFLGKRFGGGMQGTASVTFLFTRLLADGVRLFATAIPIKIVLAAYGVNAAYWQIVAVLGIAMVVYTFFGGVRAVVWVDAIQMLWYVLGGVAVIVVLADRLPTGWLGAAVDAGKTQLLDFASAPLSNNYAFVTAVLGGAVLSMASHGADQLIVQRLMACNDLRASQKALMASGVVVFLQFGLFLLIGTMLWSFYKGLDPVKDLGLATNDELFASFIVNELPSGLSGFVIAGILAAALSSSLGALASSTVTDVYQRFVRRPLTEAESLKQGRIWTVVWAGALIVFASMFTTTKNPIVETALAITGYTYGALLGAFLLGLLVRKARQADAIVAFLSTVAVMAFVILGLKFSKKTGEFLGVDFAKAAGDSVALAFPWYTPLGVAVTLVVGGLLALRHRGSTVPAALDDPDDTAVPATK